MRVILAYDGSAEADAAVADLRNAGLPTYGELLLATIQEPTVTDFSYFDLVEKAAVALRAQTILESVGVQFDTEGVRQKIASAKTKLREILPGWNVSQRIVSGSPIETFLDLCRIWNPDMIFTGSHHKARINRLLTGSFSSEIVVRSDVSVRVAGIPSGQIEPNHCIVAAFEVLGSGESILKAIADRKWPDDTKIRIICTNDEDLDEFVTELAHGGFDIIARPTAAELGRTVLDEAAHWQAGSIFLADNGGQIGSLNQTISHILERAKCSVEIIKEKTKKERATT